MVRMLSTVALALSSPVESFRLGTHMMSKSNTPTCECSETGLVDGVTTNKPGCAQHFGQRIGYICYLENGAECDGSRLSRRTGVYWRPCRGEHLTEEATGYLQDAMEELDVEGLRTTIGIARTRGVDEATIEAAEARVLVEIEMIAARDELMESLEGFDAARLQAALENAEEMELDEFLSEETLERAVERFQFLQARTESENAVRAAVEGTHLIDLQNKRRIAQTNHVALEVIDLADARMAELTQMMADADQALLAATAGTEAAVLQAAITEAERFDAVTVGAIDAGKVRLADLARRGEARADLEAAIAGVDTELVEQKLIRATDLGVNADVLSQARQRVTQIAQMRVDARAALESAVEGIDHAVLQAALTEAQRLSSTDSDLTGRANVRLAALARRGEVKDELLAAIEALDLPDLEAKIVVAEDLGVDAPTIQEGQSRTHELEHMMHSAARHLTRDIEGRDSDKLRESMAEVETFNGAVEEAQMVEARARMVVLERIDRKTQTLIDSFDSLRMGTIQNAIHAAENGGVDPAIIAQGQAAASQLRNRMARAEHNVKDLTANGTDADELQAALDEARLLNAGSHSLFDRAEEKIAELRSR